MLSALQHKNMEMFSYFELQSASCRPGHAILFRGSVTILFSRVQGESKTAHKEAENGDCGTGRRFFIDKTTLRYRHCCLMCLR